MRRTFAIVTFGCRVNQADSLRLEAELRGRGAEPASPDRADLVFVNTCSVTAMADQGARQAIRRLARANPAARIVATGCYATRRPKEVAALPGVARVVPNEWKETIPIQLLGDPERTTASRFGAGDGPCGAPLEPGASGRTAWTLRVQTGCEEACSYCIIPATRGASRSRPMADVLSEMDGLVAAGYKEVAITGVHLGSYGRDLDRRTSLEDLLDAIVRRTYPMRVRISSLEPMDCTRAIVDLVASSPALAPHFHLPLQHGSDTMLRAMGRPYALDDYRRLVDAIRRQLPHASIGADLIVGFPGETDEDVELTLDYLSGSPLTHLHVFPYSDRPGTVAAGLIPKVHGALVRDRGDRVRAAGRRLAQAFLAAQVGTVRPGLTLEDGTLVVTDNYLKVHIPPGHSRNEWVNVRVASAGDRLAGQVV